MKRKGHIIDAITLADVRREVAAIASSNRYRRKRAERFMQNFDTEGPALLASLRKNTWQPRHLRSVDIFEHGKMRHIEIPCFEDMLVQRVLFYPRLEKILVDHTWPHSFSSIKGRGPLRAAKHVARIIRKRSARWCLYFDIKKYYLHIDRSIIKKDLRQTIKDRIALALLDKVVDMGEKGIAIGNTASHFLANLYITPIIERIAGLNGVTDVVTYMDNVFVFGRSKRLLHTVRKNTITLLASRGLSMKEDWQVFRTDMRPVKIGGFALIAHRPWRIYRATFRHLLRTIKRVLRQPRSVDAARTFASLQGWIVSAGCRSVETHFINPVWPQARKVLSQ